MVTSKKLYTIINNRQENRFLHLGNPLFGSILIKKQFDLDKFCLLISLASCQKVYFPLVLQKLIKIIKYCIIKFQSDKSKKPDFNRIFMPPYGNSGF